MSKKSISHKKFHKKHSKQKEILTTKKEPALYRKTLSLKIERLLVIALIILPVIIGSWYVNYSYRQNGFFGFTLDDPWIHLTFAKNLIEYGNYSYFKNEVVTSGSTSPLYTFLIAIFYFFSKNEFIISYIVGVVFLALTVFIFYKLLKVQFESLPFILLLSILLVAIQPKLDLISVSGMETTMFIFFITATLYFYRKENSILTGLFLGLTVWCRPDGLVLWIAIGLDYLFKYYCLKSDQRENQRIKIFNQKDFYKALGTAAFFLGIYFLFNYSLSGSLLPNSYQAKIEYYFGSNRENFLKRDVIEYFSSGEFVIVWIFFFLSILFTLNDSIKKRYSPNLIFILFTIGLIAVYYIKLPFAHRFGRYLMPVIPFYLSAAIFGLAKLLDLIQKKSKTNQNFILNIIFAGFFGTTLFFSIKENSNYVKENAQVAKYHNDRHVAIGKWLKNNTSKDAVIATHDIGALAFYSDRKILDMVGLINPEVISHLNEKNYTEYAKNYFIRNNVSYFATIRNWFEAVNQKPVYIPVNEFEYFEVFKFEPEKLHFQPKEASFLNEQAIYLLQEKKLQDALRILRRSISIDPKSSRTIFLLGSVYELLGDNANAERQFKKALETFPEFADAYFGLAKVFYNRSNFSDSKEFINKSLELNPSYAPAYQLMVIILENIDKNPTAALPYREKLNKLISQASGSSVF